VVQGDTLGLFETQHVAILFEWLVTIRLYCWTTIGNVAFSTGVDHYRYRI